MNPLSYCYLPDDYEGHRPANREEIHRAGRGAVYSWPSTTTIHMDLMRRTRATVEKATDDALADEAAHQEEEFVPPAPDHRVGCSHSRTGKCICAYLAQWDNQEQPATLEASKERLADFTQQMSDEGRVITIDTLNGRTSEWDGVFQNPEPVRLQLPVVIATTAEDPAVIAEKIVKDNPQWFGELPAGTYQKREDDTAEQLRLNTELSLTFWKGQAKHWQKGYWIMAGSAVLGWGLAVARGIWGF